MQYSVVGTDGNQYGPVDLITLKQWVTEGRVLPNTEVVDSLSNRTLLASQMPELGLTAATNPYANTVAPPQNFSQYPRPGEAPLQVRQGTRLWGILFWFFLGVILSPFLITGGMLTNGLNILEAFKAKRDNDRYAVWCFVVAFTGFFISLVVFLVRRAVL